MTASHAPAASRTSPLLLVGGLAVAAVASIAVNALIAVVAHALGASDEFPPLQFGAYAFFTVLGVLAGAAGWAAVRRFSSRPAAVLRWLVPTVVAVSLVPDLLLLTSEGQPGTGVLAVVALMAMHLAIAAIAVPIYRRVMPLPDRA
jgi:hypothetical protein